MPHLAGNCNCGRPIHLPKEAVKGYRWTCHRCGKVWTLANSGHGKPVHQRRSLPPASSRNASPGSPGNGPFGAGCLVIGALLLLFLATCSLVAFSTALLFDELSRPTLIPPRW